MTTSFFEPFDRLDEKRWYVSDGWANADWHGCTWSRQAVRVSGGRLRVSVIKSPNKHRAYKCGEIQTRVRLGYGWYEARMKTAIGSGLNSNFFTYSGPPTTKVHDEIDFEFLGRLPRTVDLNYFVNGNGNHGSRPDLGLDTTQGFNTYAFEWTPERIRWFVNGRLVRTSTGKDMPQVAGKLFASLWLVGKGRDKEQWLGKADPSQLPATAEFDWIAYTRTGERCLFPESMSCRFM